jgi:O-antigen/teichoic acid export membrane protein
VALKKQVMSGSFWSAASNISVQAVHFVVLIVLARLLVPEDFGIVAISGVVVGIITLFQDLGMGSAIIQKKRIDEGHLATSFLVSFVTGVAIALSIVAVSPFIASFYGKSILKPIIMVSSIGFVLSPLMSIHHSILTKNLEFKKIGILGVLNQVLSGGTSVALALASFGVWSLVLGKLVAQVILIPIYWKTAKWTPKFRFRKSSFQELFSFSSSLLGFNILNYFSRNFDNLIVGKYLGAATLGYYSVAYNLMLKPLQLISWSVGRVLFPTFSSIQDEKERVRTAYTKVVRTISLVTFPMMTGLMIVAREFVLTFYGGRWEPVIFPLQLLCIVGALQSIGTTGGTIILSQGRSDLILKIGLFTTAATLSAFFIGVRWGLIGLIIAYIAVSVPALFIGQYFANRLIDLKMGVFFRSLFPAIVCSACMAVVLSGVKYLGLNEVHTNHLVTLAILVPGGMIVYFALLSKYFPSEEMRDFYSGIASKVKVNSYTAKKKGAIP